MRDGSHGNANCLQTSYPQDGAVRGQRVTNAAGGTGVRGGGGGAERGGRVCTGRKNSGTAATPSNLRLVSFDSLEPRRPCRSASPRSWNAQQATVCERAKCCGSGSFSSFLSHVTEIRLVTSPFQLHEPRIAGRRRSTFALLVFLTSNPPPHTPPSLSLSLSRSLCAKKETASHLMKWVTARKKIRHDEEIKQNKPYLCEGAV